MDNCDSCGKHAELYAADGKSIDNSKRAQVLRDAGLNPDEFVESKIDPANFKLADWPNTFKDLEYPCHPCAMCGHMVRWLVCFRHLPSGELIGVGEDCADYLDSDNVVEKQMKQFKTKIANAKAKAEAEAKFNAKREAFTAEYPDVVEYLREIEAEGNLSGFLWDMVYTFNRWGDLTEKQALATRKVKKSREEWAAQVAKNAPENPLPAGKNKLLLEGEVLKTDWKDGYYPGDRVKKMLVKLVDGNRVWGTVPKAIFDVRKGDKVSFVATLTRSKDDEHFGFYSHPTKAVIEKKAVTI